MSKNIVGGMSEWSGALKDLFRQIDDGSITLLGLQAFLEHRTGLPAIDWQKVYVALGMSAEYAKAVETLGAKDDPNLWVIPAVKGVTCNKLVAAMRKLGVDFYLYADDLDKNVATNDRDPSKGSYTVAFGRNVEADEENKNLSANQLKERGHKGITLLERLLLELGCFLATGKHLDEKNVTLCSGSRYSVGSVPDVFWNSDSRQGPRPLVQP